MLQRFGESFIVYRDKKLQNENNRKVKFMRLTRSIGFPLFFLWETIFSTAAYCFLVTYIARYLVNPWPATS